MNKANTRRPRCETFVVVGMLTTRTSALLTAHGPRQPYSTPSVLAQSSLSLIGGRVATDFEVQVQKLAVIRQCNTLLQRRKRASAGRASGLFHLANGRTWLEPDGKCEVGGASVREHHHTAA
jgi:hypothetical protein